ncbi:hypothetical protein EVA_17770 [gut metagenome]|uniref:Uncharacterized protein n=1 Tax=gut metagenome TaxID=749906 RepID=J9FX18_9ZZZZ
MPCLLLHRFRDAPNGFGNASHDGSQRVGIGPQADSPTDGVLEAVAVHHDPEGNRYCTLAGFVKTVPVVVQIQLKGIGFLVVQPDGLVKHLPAQDLRCDVSAERFFPVTGIPDSQRHRPGAPDAFGMVVTAGCRLFSFVKHVVHFVECPSDGTDAHGRSVTERAVRLGMITSYPLREASAIAAHGARMAAAPAMDVASVIIALMYDGICHGHSADGVVGIIVLRTDPLKMIVVGGIEFPPTPYDISYNCS